MHSDDPDDWCVAEALTPETHGGSSVCVSQFLAQQLRQRLPATNPQVIPCGITLPTAQASFSDQPFRVVVSPQGGAPDVHQFNLLRVVDNQRSSCSRSSRRRPLNAAKRKFRISGQCKFRSVCPCARCSQ